MVFGLGKGQAGRRGDIFDGLLRELRVGVNPRAHGGAAKGELRKPREHRFDSFYALCHLFGPSAEFLSEGDGHGVHQVSAARLYDIIQLTRPLADGLFEVAERWQEPFVSVEICAQVNGGRDHVV